MKISNWIKLIGILCVFFGAFGIINNLSFSLLSEMSSMAKAKGAELSPYLERCLVKLSYLKLFSDTIYLIAGIFFLLKKSFSVNLMYIALTFSILCSIIPMLFLSRNSAVPPNVYEINIFTFIGPFIDILLLIVVIRIARYYYKSGDVIVKLLGENTNKILTPRFLKILTFAGLLCLCIPVAIFGLWIYASTKGNSQEAAVALFNSYFPDFLQGRFDTAYLSIVFCILSVILSIVSLKLPGKFWKTNMLILVLSSLLLLLNLFQLM